MCYEDIVEKMKRDADELGCTVVGFNHRGVERSTGRPWSTNDLVIA